MIQQRNAFIHPSEDGEAPPLYQTLLVKGSFDDPIQLANMMATVA
jgi:hypothetical protein